MIRRLALVMGVVVAGALLVTPAAYTADFNVAPALTVPLGVTSEGDTGVDSSGRVYVTSKLASPNGKVFIYDSAGADTGVAITGLAAPDGMYVDASGNNVYVAEDGGSRVSYHYRSGGSFTAGATITGLSRPVGVTAGPDGSVFVALFGGSEVRQYTVAGTGGSLSFTLAKTFTGFNGPYGIHVDSSGNLYVSEIFQNRVKIFNAATVAACGASCAITADRTISGAATLLSGAAFMDTDSSGRLYVASYQNNSIAIFASTADGNTAPLDRIVGASTLLIAPWGMAVDGSGAIYSQNANATSYRWVKFTGLYASSSSSSGRTEQSPPDIRQEIPMPITENCSDVVDDHVSYGTGITGGWSTAWGEWANGGSGSWVCGRTLTYVDRLGQWIVVS